MIEKLSPPLYRRHQAPLAPSCWQYKAIITDLEPCRFIIFHTIRAEWPMLLSFPLLTQPDPALSPPHSETTHHIQHISLTLPPSLMSPPLRCGLLSGRQYYTLAMLSKLAHPPWLAACLLSTSPSLIPTCFRLFLPLYNCKKVANAITMAVQWRS